MRASLRHLPVLLVFAVLLAGCGGDDETTTSTTTTPTGASGATGSAESSTADPEAEGAARTAQTALEVYFTENASYAGADAKALAEIDPSLPDDLEVEGDDSTYSITAPSSSGNSFTIERSEDGKVTHSCTEPGVGSCGEDGAW